MRTVVVADLSPDTLTLGGIRFQLQDNEREGDKYVPYIVYNVDTRLVFDHETQHIELWIGDDKPIKNRLEYISALNAKAGHSIVDDLRKKYKAYTFSITIEKQVGKFKL